jgi:hypothetical protein
VVIPSRNRPRPARARLAAGAVVAVLVALGLGACGGDDDSGLAVTDLTIGTCFDEPVNAEQITEVHPVNCSGPHRYEVFATFDLPVAAGEPYPGAENVDRAASAGCSQQASAPPSDTYDTFALAPIEKGWDKGDRSVTCAATLRSGQPSTAPLSAASGGSSATTLPPGAAPPST